MKNIKIYLVSKYEYSSKIGTWTYYIEYKGAVKKSTGTMKNARSSARMLLVALIQALMCLNQPCNIVVISKVPLGFRNIISSPNNDLLCHIHDLILRHKHMASFKVDNDFSNVEEWERQAKIAKDDAEANYYDRLANDNYMMNHQYEYL
ncbi:MAG: hypothetical protein J6A59_09205 [Lachnospiraceae bacterium]|nr:hypothetical protein [Lachnospiraceae bacterium]